MLKLLFNRDALAVKIAEAIGVVLMVPATYHSISKHPCFLAALLFAIVWATYIFIRFCASVRWYKDGPRFSGIELHFKKAIVPTGYLMAMSGLLYFFVNTYLVLMIDIFLLAAIAHVNVIFLYLHFHDSSKTPPNFYTSRRFLEIEAEGQKTDTL